MMNAIQIGSATIIYQIATDILDLWHIGLIKIATVFYTENMKISFYTFVQNFKQIPKLSLISF